MPELAKPRRAELRPDKRQGKVINTFGNDCLLEMDDGTYALIDWQYVDLLPVTE